MLTYRSCVFLLQNAARVLYENKKVIKDGLTIVGREVSKEEHVFDELIDEQYL